MTRLQIFAAWSVVLLALSTSAKAQTVDDIINKYIDAIGGKAVLAGIQSVRIEGVVNVMGIDAPFTTTIVNGKAVRSETDMNGSVIIQCITDTGAWMVNPTISASPQVLTAEQAKVAKSSIYVAGPLVDYKSKGFSAELMGREAVNGVSAYKIHLFDNGGTDVTYDVDPNTYLLLKAVTKTKVSGSDVSTTTTFSNYQKTPIGYTMPYSTITSTEYDLTMTDSKVTFNQDIDPQICAMPK